MRKQNTGVAAGNSLSGEPYTVDSVHGIIPALPGVETGDFDDLIEQAMNEFYLERQAGQLPNRLRGWRRNIMDEATRQALIAQYEDGYRVVIEALTDISDEELEAREGPGEWSPREVAHHLADSEMTSAIRLRRLIAEEKPVIAGYDEEEFARRLYYDRPIDASLAAFKASRETTAEILHRLTPEEWARTGTHSASGPYGVDDWLAIYAVHAHDHADQIRRARRTVGRTE